MVINEVKVTPMSRSFQGQIVFDFLSASGRWVFERHSCSQQRSEVATGFNIHGVYLKVFYCLEKTFSESKYPDKRSIFSQQRSEVAIGLNSH